MPRKPDIPTLAAQHLSHLLLGKLSYKKADAALSAILRKKRKGIITLPDKAPVIPELRGKTFEIEDRGDAFSVGQTARRFRLKPVVKA